MTQILKFRLTESEIADAVSQYAIRKAGLLVDENARAPVVFTVQPNRDISEMRLTATVEVESK